MHDIDMEVPPPLVEKEDRVRPSQSSSRTRSVSPRTAELNELLHVRTMHSFTRRIKSFNKDRNPDLLRPPPGHMKQTCSSLIKRNSYGRPFSFGHVTQKKSRRTISMGGALHSTNQNEETKDRRTKSSVGGGHQRGQSMGGALNDQLGFLLEQMPNGFALPEGCDLPETVASRQRKKKAEKTLTRRPHTSHDHRRSMDLTSSQHVASTQRSCVATELSHKVKSAEQRGTTVSRPGHRRLHSTTIEGFEPGHRRVHSRAAGGFEPGHRRAHSGAADGFEPGHRRLHSRAAEGLERRPGSSTKPMTQGTKRTSTDPSDRTSDLANNTSIERLDDMDYTTDVGVGGETVPQPMPTLPLKEMGVAGNKSGKKTPGGITRTKVTTKPRVMSQTRKGKEVASVSTSTIRHPKNPNQKKNSTVAPQKKKPKAPKTRNEIQDMNDKIPKPRPSQEETSDIREQIKVEEEQTEVQTGQIKVKEAEINLEEDENETEEINLVEDENEAEETRDNKEGQSVERAKKNAVCEVVEERAEDLYVSEDDDDRVLAAAMTTSEAGEDLVAVRIGLDDNPFARQSSTHGSDTEMCDAQSKSYLSSDAEDSRGEVKKLEAMSSIEKLKSFMRRSKSETPPKSAETPKTSKKKKKRSRKARRLAKAPSFIVARMQCCRFSFKACFCGANVSPGPESEKDPSHSVTLYD